MTYVWVTYKFDMYYTYLMIIQILVYPSNNVIVT